MNITIPEIPEKSYYLRILHLINGDAKFSPKQILTLSIILKVFEEIYKDADEIPKSLVKHLKKEIRDSIRKELGASSSFMTSVLDIFKERQVLTQDFQLSEFYKRIVRDKIKGIYSITFVIQMQQEQPEISDNTEVQKEETYESDS